jgi:hypothetical protein
VSALQLVLQAFVPQTYGTQVEDVGGAQAPDPSQCETGVKVIPLQEAVPQGALVAASWQAPAPLQAPVLPQGGVAGHWPAGAGLPEAIGAHDPVPLTLQALQVGHEALPQQTLSVQKPLMHWAALAQARPLGLRAQLPDWQVKGATQSASAAQVVLHAVAPQT